MLAQNEQMTTFSFLRDRHTSLPFVSCYHTAVECGAPPHVQNAKANYDVTSFSAAATYVCTIGYEFDPGVYSVSIRCHADSLWNSGQSAGTCSGLSLSLLLDFFIDLFNYEYICMDKVYITVTSIHFKNIILIAN